MLARENSNAVYPGERRARRLPQRLAPFERAQEHGPVRGHQPLPRQDARLLPGQAARDAGRRRHAARPLDDSLRQQPERRQRAQLRSAADPAGGRRLGSARRRPAPAFAPHTPMSNLLLAMLAQDGRAASTRSATARSRSRSNRRAASRSACQERGSEAVHSACGVVRPRCPRRCFERVFGAC